jgi:hypothetical protein
MSEESVPLAEYCTAIGTVLHNATTAEFFLFAAFWRLAGCNVHIARAIFFASESLHAKRHLLHRLCTVVGDDEDRAIIDDIAKHVQRANNLRSDVAHAIRTAGEDPDGPSTRSNARQLEQPHRPITRAYLGSLVDGTADAGFRASQAWERLCKKRGLSPGLPSF